MKRFIATAALSLLAVPAFAEGDPEAGQKGFNKCKSCHAVSSPEGEVFVKGGKTGPNLYGIPGAQAGLVEGFKYGADIVAAGEAGLIWDEEKFVTYLMDPKKYLREFTGNSKAKSKMAFKVKKGGEDIYAFLVSVSPAPEPAAEEAAEEGAGAEATEASN